MFERLLYNNFDSSKLFLKNLSS